VELGRVLREMAEDRSTTVRDDIRAAAIDAYGIDRATDRLESALAEAVRAQGEQQAARRAAGETGPRQTPLFSDDPLVDVRIQSGWLFERRVARILQFLRDARPGDTVLEIGCGTGAVMERIHRERPELDVVGLEPVDSYADYARARLAGADPERVRVIKGYVHDLADEDVDGVTWVLSNNMLHHASDPEAILDALSTVCEPGARWLCIEPNAANPYVHLRHLTSAGERLFRAQPFLAAAGAAGWWLRARHTLFLVPPAVRTVGPTLAHLERVLERVPVLAGGIALELELGHRTAEATA
jgi:2-polyprenyl-3-methyl-5-hydroxy-6-metoxy-1,4-benzoquinol methylase